MLGGVLNAKLRGLTMKKIVMASAVMAVAAMAGGMESRPEASVPTPAEHHEVLNKVPNLSEKENVDWQKLREERRAAREQILKDLRKNSALEKNEAVDAKVKAPVVEKPVKETLVEKNVEKPKDELVREKKLEENEPLKGPLGKKPWGMPMGHPGNKKMTEPLRPINPHQREKTQKVEPMKPLCPNKGFFPSK